jgi:hypothetical protein
MKELNLDYKSAEVLLLKYGSVRKATNAYKK